MTTTSDDDRWATLIDALKLVASEPAEQAFLLPELRSIAWQIRSGGPKVDLFDEALVREGILPSRVGLLIQRIDVQFDELAGQDPDDAFDEDALTHNPHWQRMRALATDALRELGVPARGARGGESDGRVQG